MMNKNELVGKRLRVFENEADLGPFNVSEVGGKVTITAIGLPSSPAPSSKAVHQIAIATNVLTEEMLKLIKPAPKWLKAEHMDFVLFLNSPMQQEKHGQN